MTAAEYWTNDKDGQFGDLEGITYHRQRSEEETTDLALDET